MFVLQDEMTKHHYGLPKKEQINLPKIVTPPPKTNTCLPQNGLFQTWTIYIFQPLKISGNKNPFFSFKGPQQNFRPSRALKKQWETTRVSRKVLLLRPPPRGLIKRHPGAGPREVFHHGPINPKRPRRLLARLDIPDGFFLPHHHIDGNIYGRSIQQVYVVYM